MLIKCPECKHEISDKADICIYCGYPLREKSDLSNIPPEYDYTKPCLVCSGTKFKYDKETGYLVCEKCGCVVAENKEIHDLYVRKHEKTSVLENILKCPKCGSTAVTTGQRGYSLWTGFLGAGKTVNRCGSCGYKWKP